MATTYRIPKLTDRELAAAVGRIRNKLKGSRDTKVVAHLPHIGGIDLQDPEPENTPRVAFAFDLHARVVSTFQLMDTRTNQPMINVYRKHDQITDEAQLPDDWTNHAQNDERQTVIPQLQTKLMSEAQREFRVDDLNASFAGTSDNEWNRYRTAQMEVLNSLQQTNQRLLVDMEKSLAATRAAELAKNENVRAQLKKDFESEQGRLAQIHGQRLKELEAREVELKKKESEYETHAALYQARKNAKEQLEQLKAWLKDSSLTKETVQKRRPVLVAYVAAIVITAAISAWYSHQGYELLKGMGPHLSSLPWWQWVAITAKAVVPLAAFTTFAIYFIRWEGAWAKQHAEEELRTRARIIDIGRSSWLLEAARDSKDGVTPALIGELSRNLFSNSVGSDVGDLHPQAISDLLAQNLTSFRVKSPDGSEFEAQRGKGKK